MAVTRSLSGKTLGSGAKVALVLGGGGITGLAYQAGALLALEQDFGWDPRTADCIVGTSAGAITGALLRRGVPPSDLAAMTVGVPTRATPDAIRSAVENRQPFPPLRLRDVLLARRPHLPNGTILMHWLRRPWRIDATSALASVVADGALDLAMEAMGGLDVFGDTWPDDALWICAVRQQDLHRVVVGRDIDASLSMAVAASCAIPGYFKPVAIDGTQCVDGGVRSPMNADVLRRSGFDLVIAVSPMSGRDLPLFGAGPAVRRYAHRSVTRELARVEGTGTPSVLIEPGAAVCSLMGTDFMDESRVRDILCAAFLDTGAQLRSDSVADFLYAIDARHAA